MNSLPVIFHPTAFYGSATLDVQVYALRIAETGNWHSVQATVRKRAK